MGCDLCDLKGAFLRLTICKTCHVPMVVHAEHKPEFSDEEKQIIERMFPGASIRWRMRRIKDHAHAHLFFQDQKDEKRERF